MPKYFYIIITLVALIITFVPPLLTIHHVPGIGFIDFVKVEVRVLLPGDNFVSSTGDYYG